MKKRKISDAVVRRLPRYYRYLDDLHSKGIVRISSSLLGERMGITASQIRQDLSCFGEFGQQGYGYNILALRTELGHILGVDEQHRLGVVGAGHLVKGHPILAPAGHLHPGLAEFSHFVLSCSAAVHAAHKPHDQQKAQYPHDIRQQCRHPVGGMNKILLLHGAALHLLLK